MSFEVKYDQKGNVITPNPVPEQPEEVQTTAYLQSPEDPEQPEDIVEELPEPVVAQPAEQKSKSDAEINLARLRQKAEAAERERDELRRQLEAQQRPVETQEDLSISMNDDELVEGRHISKVDKKIRNLEAKLMQYEQINTQMAIEQKLKSQYPDFNEIVSVENVQKLQQDYPEIMHTLRAGNDLYAQGVSAYTMIKKLGIVPDDGISSLNKIKANAVKPRTVTSISAQQGNSPLTKANPFAEGLTDDLKAALLKEMNDAARRA